jgi:hypothetical protein
LGEENGRSKGFSVGGGEGVEGEVIGEGGGGEAEGVVESGSRFSVDVSAACGTAAAAAVAALGDCSGDLASFCADPFEFSGTPGEVCGSLVEESEVFLAMSVGMATEGGFVGGFLVGSKQKIIGEKMQLEELIEEEIL